VERQGDRVDLIERAVLSMLLLRADARSSTRLRLQKRQTSGT
jgi:hypothetical protein